MTKDLMPVVEKEITPVIASAEKLVIVDDASLTVAAEMLTQINRAADKIEDEKEKVTKPLNQALKAERSRWKPLETMLDTAKGIVSRKMGDYRKMVDERVRKEEEKIAARVGEGKGYFKPETAADKIGAIDRPDKVVKSETGSVNFRTDRKLKITNVIDVYKHIFENKLDILIDLNEKRVLEYLKEGFTLPGAEIEEIKTPINKR